MIEDYGVTGTIEINEDEFAELSGLLSQRADGVKAVWLLMDGQEISIDWFVFA
jgi:hypothetical protein